jgi:two-component system, chemotaxis family, protein-glutamate methylesterase/glutaminase
MNQTPTLMALKGLVEDRTGNRFKNARWETVILPILVKICCKEGRNFSLSELFLALKKEPVSGHLWAQVIGAVTVHKTDFFREAHHFEFLKRIYAQHLKTSPNRIFRIWSAACSTGEEAYTIAFALSAVSGGAGRFEILGTDLDEKVVEVAKNGVYITSKIISNFQGNPSEFFDKGSGEISQWCRVKNVFRKNITFKTANLMSLGGFEKDRFDFVFCRNVFIYFDKKTINAIVQQFLRVLQPTGHLAIGTTESLEQLSDSWNYVEPSIYQKKTQSQLLAVSNAVMNLQAVQKPQLLKSAVLKKVLVVDDSPTMQRLIESVLKTFSSIEIVGFAATIAEAKKQIEVLKPDILTLDIQLPDGTGIDLLRWILTHNPKPCIMISSLDPASAPQAVASLELGAIDYIRKRSFEEMPRFRELLAEALDAASQSTLGTKKQSVQLSNVIKPTKRRLSGEKRQIIALGASTGGIQTLKKILLELPAGLPCILIVQHIPALFSKAFSDQLSQQCRFPVKEAQNGDLVQAGVCYVAPGGFQMSVEKKASQLYLKVEDTEKVSGHKPSVDHLFLSLAKHCPENTLAVLLTGMGADGAKGLLALKNAGAMTIAQDEDSCVVYGMPRVAIEMGAAQKIVSLVNLPQEIVGN